MNINEIKHGFKLLYTQDAKDINSVLYVYEHIKSGGKVMYLKNDDTNCVCAFGFKTLPEDSTGVCHIIEHSTLCGSKKYPLKEPFVNLIKGSLNTFLNAFTNCDWTMYPFASQTPKDFDNIMKIYADAVFNPLSVEDIKPFLQEGWHYELKNEEDTPLIKGVVYNEMIGAMSNVSRILFQATLEAMYKDSFYRFNSGGDPDCIPNLTYEAYKDFYKRHYTPQNCMTYFYGDLDIEAKLKFLDEEYFSNYEKTNEEIVIKPQKPYIDTSFTKEYAIGEQEDTKDNTYIALAYGLNDYNDNETFLAMTILVDALLSSNESPLKKALLDAKLGQDIDYSFDDANIQPALHIQLKKTNPNKKEAFKKVFEDNVRKLVEEGIDKELLLASINHSEFKDKECDMGRMPKGIIYSTIMMSSFDYNGDLLSHLEYSKYYDKFRKELNNGYFEKLLEKYILNSKHNVEVVLIPSKTLSSKKNALMEKKMNDLKNSLSKEEKKALVKQTQELIAYQNHVDTKKELKTLPTLKISDIPTTINYLDTKRTRVHGLNGFYHVINTNNIAYVKLYFSLNTIKFEDLPYVFLLKSLLGDLGTKKYSSLKLNSLMKTYLGDFSISEPIYSRSKTDVEGYLKIGTSALVENIDYIPEIVNEVLLNTIFTKKEIKQILSQLLIGIKQSIISNGMNIAMAESRASYTKDAALSIYTFGSPEMYNFLKELNDNFDFAAIKAKLKEISKKLFNKKNAKFSISGDLETIEKEKEMLLNIKLPSKKYEEVLDIKLKEKQSCALVIQSGVSYNAKANNMQDLGFEYTPKYIVISHIINMDYLWNNVRVKGGAYGCNIAMLKASKNFVLGSFRDPNVANTFEVYKGIGEYLRTFNPSKDEFKSYIIGAVGGFDVPQSVPSFIDSGDTCYLSNVTKKDRIALKKEMLKVKIEDVNAASLLFNKMDEGCSIYTIGNEQKIKEYYFDKVDVLK